MASRKVFGRMVRQYGLLSAAAIAAALQVQSATADTFTWSHTTNTAWNTSAADWTNTSGATAWVNNQAAPHTAVFGAAGSGGTPRAITLGGYNTYYVGGITFLNSGWNILGGNSQTWFAGASNGAPIVITNAIDTTNSIGNNAVLSDDIFSATQLPSGEPISTSVTFTGAGTINLGGNSTYTGLTTIGGTITVKLANATGGAAGRIGVVGGLDFTGAGTFDMNTSSAIIGALKGVAGSTIINTHTSSNVAMLTINGVGDVAFHGVIKDSNTGGASNTGKLALTLTGGLTETFTAAQGYSGATAVGGTTTTGIGRSNAATLILDFSKSYSPETDMLYSKGLTSTSTLTLAGNGSLTLKGKDETNNSQDFTSVAFSSGFATITLQAGANDGTDGTMALNMGTFSRATGGTAKFVADMDSTITTTTTSVLNGVLTGGTGSAIAFATFGTTDWASRLTDAGVQSIGALASYDDDDFAATKNVNVTPSVTPQSGITANTLRFNSNATLPLSGVNTVNTGGILVTSNTTNVTIEGGTLRPGSSGNELSFFNYGALLALDTVLANNGTSHVTFSGSPTSTTLIQQPATYTGTTTINNTIVSLDNDVMEEKYGSLGSGALTINGGTLELNGRNNQTFGATANNGIITNAGNEKVTLTVAGASTGTNLAHAGKFIGPMDLVWNGGNTSTFAGEFIGIEKFTKDGTGTLTLNGNNTLAISGGIDVLGGTLNIGYGINSTAGAYIGNANIVGDVYIASGATLNIFPVAQSATNKDMAYTNDYALGPVPSGEDEVQRIQLAGTLNINNATLNVKRGIFLGTDAGTMGAINGNATINSNSASNTSDNALEIRGGNTVILNNTLNAYSGGTVVTSGWLRFLGDGANVGDTSALGIVPNASLSNGPDNHLSDNIKLYGTGAILFPLETIAVQTLNANRGIQLHNGGGSFVVGNNVTLVYNGTITEVGGPAQFWINRNTGGQAGTVALGSTSNSFTGGLVVQSGNLRLGASDNETAMTGPLGAIPADVQPENVIVYNNNGVASVGTYGGSGDVTVHKNRGFTINTTGTFTFNGGNAGDSFNWDGTITMGATNIPSINFTGSGNIYLGASQTLTINQLLANSGNGIYTLSNNWDLTSAAAVMINVSSAGTLALTGNNTFRNASGTPISPMITVSGGGFIAINDNAALGLLPTSTIANQITLNNGGLRALETFTLDAKHGITISANAGTISVDDTKTLTYNGLISGVNFVKTGLGTLDISGNTGIGHAYTGTTTINEGTLKISDDAQLGTRTGAASLIFGNGTMLGGTLSVSTDVTIATARGIRLHNNAIGTFDVVGSSKTLAYAGVIDNQNNTSPGSIVKTGDGTLSLSGANTYTGSTTIKTGTLELTGTAGNLNSSFITVGDTYANRAAIFDVSGLVDASSNPRAFTLGNTRTLSGHGTVTGLVTTQTGSRFAPGTLADIGTLSFADSLTLAAGGNATNQVVLDYNFAASGNASDSIFANSLTLPAGNGAFNYVALNMVSGPSTLAAGSTVNYELFSYNSLTPAIFLPTSGSIADGAITLDASGMIRLNASFDSLLTGLPDGSTYTIDTSVNTSGKDIILFTINVAGELATKTYGNTNYASDPNFFGTKETLPLSLVGSFHNANDTAGGDPVGMIQRDADLLLSTTANVWNDNGGTVEMAWRTRTNDEAGFANEIYPEGSNFADGQGLFSDVVRIEGLVGSFILEMTFDPDLSFGISIIPQLAFLDDGLWTNVCVGEDQGDLTDFLAALVLEGGSIGDLELGTWGWFGNKVWAVVDRNGDYAVIPEPASLALLGLGAAALLVRRRR